jgi:predicted CoA-binding protein
MQPIMDFLASKRIAIVGVSRTASDYTRIVFDEFSKRGYDVQPVNPNAFEIKGRACYPCVSAIQPPVDAALLLTKSPVTEAVSQECVDAGIRRVWIRQNEPDLAAKLHAKGLEVVEGECPLMFLENPGWPHKAHGWLLKLVGKYPIQHA